MADFAKEKAIELLSRREHSRRELFYKLKQRGYAEQEIDLAIDELIQKDWQSDFRFAESFIRARQLKGQGSVKISYELKEKGVADDLIAQLINEQDDVWMQLIARARNKRYGEAMPLTLEEKLKQKKFLVSRGFSFDQINQLFSE